MTSEAENHLGTFKTLLQAMQGQVSIGKSKKYPPTYN
jgi:hypothetical protein